MKHTMIEVKKLETSPLNARRTASQAASEEMKASILAHGLMQNLVVTAGSEGRYHVIAGSRRLEALRALQASGHLPDDHAVPCHVVGDDHALEMSLAENTVRLAMHPADEFEAFARLIDGGDSVEHIAERFGVSARHVEQRLKLGRVAPELLAEYRAGKLTLECLMAFAITDDQAKQLQVYDSLLPWQAADAGEIRALLTEQMAEAGSKLARFVGLDAYRAAGGSIRSDLFAEDVFLEDRELLHRLVGEKLDAVRRELEEEGWKWVEISPDRDWSIINACGRIRPQPVAAPTQLFEAKARIEAELEEIEQALEDSESDALIDSQEEAESQLSAIDDELASFVAYDPQQIRLAGCYVTIDQNGGLHVDKGLVRREDMKQLSPADAGKRKLRGGLPETLRRDLEAYRLQAAQAEIARHRLVALDLLIFTAACNVFDRAPVSGLDVHFRTQTPSVKEQTAAGDALRAIAERLPLAWLHQETEAERFQAFASLTDKEKLDLLAYCVATSLKPQLSTGSEDSAYELVLSLTDARVESYWRPTKSNYLGRITRDQLLSLGRELLGEQWAQARSRDKKGELAEALERAFATPESVTGNPVQIDRLKRWLPNGMAFGATVAAAAAEVESRIAA